MHSCYKAYELLFNDQRADKIEDFRNILHLCINSFEGLVALGPLLSKKPIVST